MIFSVYSRSHIFRHSRLWAVVTSVFVAGAVTVFAGSPEIPTDGSALIEAVDVTSVRRVVPETSEVEHPSPVNDGPPELPDFTETSSDIDASTVPATKPVFRVATSLQDLPGSKPAEPTPEVVVVTTWSAEIGQKRSLVPAEEKAKKGEVSQQEMEGIAKELYNAFAASDNQRAAEPILVADTATKTFDAEPSGQTETITETTTVAVTAPATPEQSIEVNQPPEPVATETTVVTTVDAPPAPEASTPPASDELTSSAPPTASQNVTINLINRLVKRGLLTKEDATDLIQQAEADAQQMQEQAVAMQTAIYQTQAAVAQTASAPPPTEDSVRVTYVPEIVKKQIKSEIKDDLMAQAKSESWAAPRFLPPWVEKLHPFADIRVRLEGDFFPSGNDNTGAFPNFNAINTGAPFDVAGNQFSPQINVDQNRYRVRLRARAGVAFDLGENFSGGLRLATGDSNSPVSQNQSLGLPYQGQGGNFSKYAIWLDRAFIKYEVGGEKKKAGITVGRFDNPFFTVSEIMWDNDIGFDGFALQAEYQIFTGFTPFINGGAFPIYNTDFNFSSNQPAKFASDDKWLYAGQLGFDWEAHKDIEVKFGAAYYYFQNVEGELSSPFTPQTINDAGDTDASRPSFAQKGNTYMALRDIVPDASNDFGAINQWQYFGLATPFQNLVLTGRIDYKRFEPVVISLFGEYAKNLSFNSGAINEVAVNNRGPNDDDLSDTIGSYAGGDTAWIVGVEVGKREMLKRWDWNVSFGYRYVESDAVIDGFNDSDFGGGGTNLKGYTIAGHLALAANVWIGIRWMSAESIAGPPYKEDIIQFDINSRF